MYKWYHAAYSLCRQAALLQSHASEMHASPVYQSFVALYCWAVLPLCGHPVPPGDIWVVSSFCQFVRIKELYIYSSQKSDMSFHFSRGRFELLGVWEGMLNFVRNCQTTSRKPGRSCLPTVHVWEVDDPHPPCQTRLSVCAYRHPCTLFEGSA